MRSKFYVSTGAGTLTLLANHAQDAAVIVVDRFFRRRKYFAKEIRVSEGGFEVHSCDQYVADEYLDTGVVLDAVRIRRQSRKN